MKKRFDALDGIRGILSVTVMMSHVIGSYAGWGKARPFIGAHLSVFYFFMMSGFVLSYANSRYNFKTNCMLRIARLWPLMVVSSLIMLVIYYLHSKHGGYVSSADVFSPYVIIKNIFFMYGLLNNFILLNEPSWSISLEFWISLFIPLFYLKVKKGWKLLIIAILIGFSIHSYGLQLPGTLLTAAICMLIGSVCYELSEHLGKLNDHFMIFATFCFATCLIAIYYVSSFRADLLLIALFIPCLFIDKLDDDVRLKKVLSSAFFVFLGRISFPLYLIHGSIIVSGIVSDTGQVYSKIILCSLVSICISYAYAVCIDEPVYSKLKSGITKRTR